jgi:hypothetical protein
MKPTDSPAIHAAFGPAWAVKQADAVSIVPERATRWIALHQVKGGNVTAYHMPRAELLPFAWALLKEWWRTRPGGMRTW